MNFIERNFNIPQLTGISTKAIEEHLKLYAGYVKHANLILEELKKTSEDITAADQYAINEMRRRFGFEFDGIKNHEYFFEQFEGGASELNTESALCKKIVSTWGDLENWKRDLTATALTRGIGWAILYYDPKTDNLMHAWVDEQHLGHLTGLTVITAFDVWEHAYLFDYTPAQKKDYVSALFTNINWSICEKRFQDVQ